MIETNWYVITGAPSSGKTTLINLLSQMGFRTAPEVARNYIRHLLLSHHKTLDDIRNDIEVFQRQILAIMLERERQLPHDQEIFFDRGTPDSTAYFRYHHLDSQHVVKTSAHHRYKKIFYCHGLPVVNDDIRREDEETAKALGKLIYEAYIELGYPIIELPAFSVEERMQIIMSHIEADH